MTERTKIKIIIEGVDITKDISNSLLSLTYVDNDTNRADDLQITIDDKEGKWLHFWLNQKKNNANDVVNIARNNKPFKIGDNVIVTGRPQYTSYGGNPGREVKNHKGKITHLNKKNGVPYPIHVDYLGWFKESQISEAVETKKENSNTKVEIKGLEVSAVIIQENYAETNKSKILDCGVFNIDTIDVSGPPTVIKFKALSIPKGGSIKEEVKTKAWEEINLENIGREISKNAGLKYMFDSTSNPKYKRREQKSESDLKFLIRLCKDSGVSVKITSNILVLYDASKYEDKKAIENIVYGKSNIIRYGFNTNDKDKAYTGAVVKSKDPKTGKYIEFAYNLPNVNGQKKILEIKDKVNNIEEAKKLAINRLRSANVGEYNATITLIGNVDYVASQNINIKGFGLFDGKYFINTATHKLTGGYTTTLKMSKVLEG